MSRRGKSAHKRATHPAAQKNKRISEGEKRVLRGEGAITLRSCHDDIVSKIAEARSRQLSDAAPAWRVPLLLSITWALLWAWTIYKVEFGYNNTYKNRYIALNAYVDPWLDNDNSAEKRFAQNAYVKSHFANDSSATSEFRQDTLSKICEINLGIPKEISVFGRLIQLNQRWRINFCQRIIRDRLAHAEKKYDDNRSMVFPGGFGTVEVSDLGILANLGLLLILSWGFYAGRRERDAVSSFVKFDGDFGHWSPQTYRIKPADNLLKAQHLSIAYYSVANRFLFLFSSSKAKPKIVITAIIISLPFLVSLSNFVSDLLSFSKNTFENSVTARFVIEVFLLGGVGFLTYKSVVIAKDISFLLYGWLLGVEEVWAKEWDQSTPSSVEVDTVSGSAVPGYGSRRRQ